MGISGTVATAFTVQGFWVVLPFTVLEMSLLAACLYYCVRRTHQMEVLRLTRSKLVFERGIRRPSQRYDFDRYFARFLVESSPHPWYSKRIELRCRERALEVGRFLGVEDKDQLVRELKGMIHQLDAPSSS